MVQAGAPFPTHRTEQRVKLPHRFDHAFDHSPPSHTTLEAAYSLRWPGPRHKSTVYARCANRPHNCTLLITKNVCALRMAEDY